MTSASSAILPEGQLIWSPIELMSAIQDYYDSSPAVRAAAFFVGIGCTCAQLSINVLLNSVSTGMDMAGLWVSSAGIWHPIPRPWAESQPKYINIRRGAFILAACGLASNPWQILSSAAIFLNVISGLGVFIAP